MAYVVCVNKASPCCAQPVTVPSAALCIRSLEVYGCSPDLTAGEKGCCCQGTTTPTGCLCSWTVPAGVLSVTVELWGGGSGGPAVINGDCCGSNPGGGAGTWVRQTFPVAPGDVLDICAGAGGCQGGSGTGNSNWCCAGGRGACSLVSRNGTICADSHGGRTGTAQCYWYCGCQARGCGSPFASEDPTGDNGCNYGCTGYRGASNFPTTYHVSASPTGAVTPGCGGYCSNQQSLGGSAPWGGDGTWHGYSCNCWSYYRFNTSCTNTNSVAGIGGDNPGQLILTVTNTTVSTNVLTISTTDTAKIPVGTQVYFLGTVFGGIEASTAYYVASVPTNSTFTVSLTRGGGAITLSTATGSMSMYSRNETVSAYNTPGTAQYTCGTSSHSQCERHNTTKPGNFPGGGGSSANMTQCYYRSTTGGIGAAGYVRVYF